MYKKFSSSHFRHLSKINQPNIGEKPKNKEFVSKYVEKDRFCDGLLMGLIMFIVLNPPITLMFWSSWHLSLLALNSNIGMMAIVAIIIANLATTILAIRVISSTICNAPITIGLTQSEYRKEIL
jgi:hypothetical protein